MLKAGRVVKVEEAAQIFIRSNKKRAEFDWREWTEHLERTQAFYAKAAQTQTFAEIELGRAVIFKTMNPTPWLPADHQLRP
jgi:hypothetical protein